MKYILKLTLLTLMSCAKLEEAPVSVQSTELAVNAWEEFIPSGYRLLSRASGDLNGDGLEDAALALAEITEEKPQPDENGTIEYGVPVRPLLLLLRQPDNSLALAQRNDNAIMCFYCGGPMGDAFESIVINPGSLSIYHYGGSAWRWTTEVTFSYDAPQSDWLLVKTTTHTFNAFHEDESENITEVKTRKNFGDVTFSEFNIYDTVE